MDTGTDLSIYTNIFGWYYYGLFIQLISSYGLWIIGFLVILWGATFSQASRNGRYDPRSSLLYAEYHIYLMLFILVFAVIPTIGVSTSFFHNGGKTSGNTDTSFDALSASAPASIKIPAAWFIVWKLNGGITSVMRAALPNEDNMRQYLTSFQDLMITDAAVSAEVGNFNSNCFGPALATYKTLGRDYPNSQLYLAMQNELTSSINRDRTSTNPAPEYDIYYQGNLAFTKYLYTGGAAPYCATGQDPNSSLCLPRMASVDHTRIASVTGGQHADCNSWWGTASSGGVKNNIIQHMNDERPDDVTNAQKFMQFIGWDSNAHNDMLVKKGLNTNAAPETRTPYGDGAWNSLKEGVGAAGLTWVNWLAQFLNTMITAFLPQLHAVMILLLLIMAPIISIIGLARPSAIIRLLLVAFIINLWIPIWIIVNWVDNVLLSLLYENQGWLDSVFDMGYVLASLLTLSLYTAIPMLASYYIFVATTSAVANHTSTMAGAGGQAGAMTGGAAGGAAMSAGRRGIGAARGAGSLAAGGVKKLRGG